MAKRKRTTWTAAQVRALRDSLDMTQEQAAERIGVSTRTWIAWENRQTKPSAAAGKLLDLLKQGKL